MKTSEQLKNELTNVESQIVESVQPASKPEHKQAKKPAPVVRLPRKDEPIVFCSKLYNFVEFAESEEDEEFAVIHEYSTRRGQCLVIPKQAFFGEYESKEFLEGKPTGKVFKYVPDKKTQTIVFTEKSKTQDSIPATFYYPSASEEETLQKAKAEKQAQRKANAEKRKAEKQAQKAE